MLINDFYVTNKIGSGQKRVECENCGRTYEYTMRRRGQGKQITYWGITTRKIKERAKEKAEENLKEQLRDSNDPVPCPYCYQFQADMVKRLKLWYWSEAAIAGAGFTAIGICVALTRLDSKSSLDFPYDALCLAIGIPLLALKFTLSARLNPNEWPLEKRRAMAQARAQEPL